MGNTVVSIRGNQNCGSAGTLPATVKRCYEITPTTSRTATVRFYYRSSEANGNTTPNAYHWNGSSWDALPDVSRGGSGDAMWVQATATSYSPFTLKDNQPTAVTLTSFRASASKAILPLAGIAVLGSAAGLSLVGAALLRRRVRRS